jgi:hypothetical protein
MASPSSSGYTSALEGLVDEYRKRIVKLEIEIEDLKEDRMTLASHKNKLLLNFAQIQAQYGQAVVRLQIFEQFHREAQAVSLLVRVSTRVAILLSLESSSFLRECYGSVWFVLIAPKQNKM